MLQIGKPVRVEKDYPEIGIKAGDEGIVRELKTQRKKSVANVDFDIKFGIILTKDLTPIEKRTKIKEVPMAMIIDEETMDEINKANGHEEKTLDSSPKEFVEPEWMRQEREQINKAVHSPKHYTVGGIETIDFLKAKLSPEQYEGFLLGNVLKYVSRLGKKDDAMQDAKKAQWYLNRYVDGK
jgi:hypothetical protein